MKHNFNPGWKVLVDNPSSAESPLFNDEDGKDATLPHAWNDDAFRVDIANLSTGIAWYRKHFDLPATSRNKKLFLEFEGIRHSGEFCLNGNWIGRSENGVMAFGFDVWDAVLYNPTNVLAAQIDNSWTYREKATNTPYQWNDRDFYADYGGINKNVFLHVTDRLYQTLPLYSNLQATGVYIYASDLDIPRKSATINAETQVRNQYPQAKAFQYQVEIHDAVQGKKLKTITGDEYTLQPNATRTIHEETNLSDLNFWSWEYGYLYDVRTSLLLNNHPIDTVTTRIGFHKTDFARGAFKLNDRTLHQKGYA